MTKLELPEQPLSFWLVNKSHAIPTQILIVGGGIVGASTAWWLTKLGAKKSEITLIEADSIAKGATGQSIGAVYTGGIFPYTKLVKFVGEDAAKTVWQLSIENQILLKKEISHIPQTKDLIFNFSSFRSAKKGGIEIKEWEESFNVIEHLFPESRSKWISEREVAKLTGSNLLGGAFFTPLDFSLNPHKLAVILAEHSQVNVIRKEKVRFIEPKSNGLLVVGSNRRYIAQRVIVAANVHARSILPELNKVITPVRLEAFSTEKNINKLPGCWLISDAQLNITQYSSGEILVTGGGWQYESAVIPTLKSLPTATVQVSLEKNFFSIFKKFNKSRVLYRWAGIEGLTPNRLPVIDISELSENIVYTAGMSNYGFSLGFIFGKILAQWAIGKEELKIEKLRILKNDLRRRSVRST